MRNEKSQLKIGVILNYINIGLGNLIPIFYTPIMLNLLGTSEYGLYKLSSSVTSYLSLMSLGIGAAVTRYLIKYRTMNDKEGEEKILGLFMVIFQFIAIITFIVGTFLTMNLDVWYSQSLTNVQLFRMRIIVFIMVCNMSISFAISPYISVVNAHEKFVFQQWMNILSTCVAPIVNVIVLLKGFASIGMVVSSLIIQVIVQFGYLVYVRNCLKIRAIYKDLPLKYIKEILVFSFWVFLSNIVAQLYNATDVVMIGAVPTLATVGTAVYSVGTTLNNIANTMAMGMTGMLSPKIYRLVFSKVSVKELTDFSIKIGRIQSYIISLIVSGFVAFGQPFIYFYAGKDYKEAYWVAAFIMIPNMIPLIQSTCLNIIIAQNRHRFRSIIYLIIAIINVIGTWIMMQYMGIVGAALVTGICLFVGQGVIMDWYYWRKIHLNIPRFWKEVGKVFVIPILLCSITMVIAKYVSFYRISTMVGGIVVYTLFFGILNWKFVMNKYEKKLCSDFFNRFFRYKEN